MSLFLSIGEAMVELARADDTGGRELWQLGFAGDTLNTAWYARACLPAPWQVEYLTRLGQDPFSPKMLAFLRHNDIGTRFIAQDDQRSVGLYAIQLKDGERSFAYWRGQSAARELTCDPALLDAAFAAADAIYLSGITLAILPEAARADLLARITAAREAGKWTAFDPNIRPKLWESPDALRHWLHAAAQGARVLLPSFDDEAQWFGDRSPLACAERWAGAGASEVAVKNGGGTITLWHDGKAETLEVEKVVPKDSTGAGDAFNGGYLAGRLCGRPPLQAARAGHDTSLAVIVRSGALVPMADLR